MKKNDIEEKPLKPKRSIKKKVTTEIDASKNDGPLYVLIKMLLGVLAVVAIIAAILYTIIVIIFFAGSIPTVIYIIMTLLKAFVGGIFDSSSAAT